MRKVIALDDRPDEPEPEEAWEYVSSVGGGEEDPRVILSYAEVVAKAAA